MKRRLFQNGSWMFKPIQAVRNSCRLGICDFRAFLAAGSFCNDRQKPLPLRPSPEKWCYLSVA
jgi:hypothetical protein